MRLMTSKALEADESFFAPDEVSVMVSQRSVDGEPAVLLGKAGLFMT